MGAPASLDYTLLCGELEDLLSAPLAADDAERSRVERTLTDGYASAMALEAERLRLERRIGEVAAQVSVRNPGAKTEELEDLSIRLSRASTDLRRLRELLAAVPGRTADAA